jgi:hypothetical protein
VLVRRSQFGVRRQIARSIHRTTRCHVAGRSYFAEPPLAGLKPGSPGGFALPIAKRGDVARTAPFRKDLRPTK